MGCLSFTVDEKQAQLINKWLAETVYPEVIEKQKSTIKEQTEFMHYCWDSGYPWEGASGGGLIYQFCNTSLGTVTRVLYHGGYELDVTPYEEW